MYALLDGKTVRALYAASQAGVEVDLIIRGMCSLRPGVKGMSENIRVRSIVGRFLEHSRIFWFRNGSARDAPGQAQETSDTSEVYCGSADWMPRNLYDRCETVFPVQDAALRCRLRDEILQLYLEDTAKARLLLANGTYVRPPAGKVPLNAQERLMEIACGKARSTIPPAASGTKGKQVAKKTAKRKANASTASTEIVTERPTT